MRPSVYQQILQSKKEARKSVAVLIDPDDHKLANLESTVSIASRHHVDYFFVGGSLILQDRMDECLRILRERSNIPIVLFPGDGFQISHHADALLFLSLVSGRNADYLIGKHVEISPRLYKTTLEVIPTAYLLIDGQSGNTASYISQTLPIPRDKHEIALATALAAGFLGFRMLYLDAGSGASKSVSPEMVKKVCELVELPVIVGGGVRSGDQAASLYKAGADLLVIGNAVEGDPSLIAEITGVAREHHFADRRDA